jgi:hypothetical protein
MDALRGSSKEAGLEGNREKTMLMYRHQNAGQNHNIKIAHRFSDCMVKLECLRMTVANQN